MYPFRCHAICIHYGKETTLFNTLQCITNVEMEMSTKQLGLKVDLKDDGYSPEFEEERKSSDEEEEEEEEEETTKRNGRTKKKPEVHNLL